MGFGLKKRWLMAMLLAVLFSVLCVDSVFAEVGGVDSSTLFVWIIGLVVFLILIIFVIIWLVSRSGSGTMKKRKDLVRAVKNMGMGGDMRILSGS